MVDIHQHIIFGMDDGSSGWDETVHMLVDSQRQGVRWIIATSHATPGVERFDLANYYNRINAINKYAHDEGIATRLFPGAEIFYTPSAVDELEAKRVPSMCLGSAALIEFVPDERYDEIFDGLRSIATSGYTPILAHVERYECLIGRIDRIIELKAQLNALIQMNCRTVIKPVGFTFGRFCGKLLGEGIVDFVASDAHNSSSRPVMMKEAYQALLKRYGKQTAEALTGGNQYEAFPRLR